MLALAMQFPSLPQVLPKLQPQLPLLLNTSFSSSLIALSFLEKFQNLQHLSISNVDVSSLEQFPRLQNLQKLILSDNIIAGGLEFLVETSSPAAAARQIHK
ncbi:hypothetical protein ACFX19_031645 [Malus domestica]